MRKMNQRTRKSPGITWRILFIVLVTIQIYLDYVLIALHSRRWKLQKAQAKMEETVLGILERQKRKNKGFDPETE